MLHIASLQEYARMAVDLSMSWHTSLHTYAIKVDGLAISCFPTPVHSSAMGLPQIEISLSIFIFFAGTMYKLLHNILGGKDISLSSDLFLSR